MPRMIKLFMLVCWIQLYLIPHSNASESTEHLIWDKRPLKITLPVDSERMITFPSPVKAGLPLEVNQKLRTQINGNTIYWLAHESFNTQRVEIRAVDGSAIYLLDLQAKKQASSEPLEVVTKQTGRTAKHSTITGGKKTEKKGYRPLGMIGLSRFAAQQLYSPARLLTQPMGVHRVSVHRTPMTHLLRGVQVIATPVAAWKNEFLYVTAIELKNMTQNAIELDPRWIRGAWKSATFQHIRLHPAGDESDTTALYLISDRPFHEVL